MTAIFLAFLSFAAHSEASIQKSSDSLIKLRAWNHATYLRIVLEGSEPLISRGKVSQGSGEVVIDFGGSEFTVLDKQTFLKYLIENKMLHISLKDPSGLKTFTLKSPSRLVIDVYDKASKDDIGKKSGEPKKEKPVKKDPAKVTGKKEKKNNNVVEKEDRKETAPGDAETEAKKPDTSDKAVRDSTADVTEIKKEQEDDLFVPLQYKGLWTLLQSGNFYTVLKELPHFVPDDLKSLAAYHYMYGDAYRTAQQYLDAIKHLRLAYLYAQDQSLKERALFERAELYKRLRLVYEARANYLVFIKEFTSSSRLADAHLGLAETLSEMELYNEAVEHYSKAGNTPEILFSKANSLQRIGKVTQARRAYADALLSDTKYPSRSPETYYFIGENMRMLGELEEAKKHLRSLDFGPYRDHSRLSLGHIAMEESDIREAITNYNAAAKSGNRDVRVEGLFYLSRALLKAERLDEAISHLEIIRHEHMNSGMYKESILELSKIYKKSGRMKESVSLLKELVYGMQAPKEAFKEIEDLLLSADEGEEFVSLWREVGQWMIDATREDLLILVSEKLRSEGKSFIELATWLVENGSKEVRGRAAVNLADYFIGIGSIEDARKYIEMAGGTHISGDSSLRVQAKLHFYEGEYNPSLEKLMSIKKYKSDDLDLVGSIITRLEKTEERLKAVAFYETVLNGSEWAADKYNRMADILYTRNEKNKALTYYRIALKKSPNNEWAAYRIGQDGDMNDSKEMFSQLQQSDTVLGRLAKTKLKEIDLINKMEEVY